MRLIMGSSYDGFLARDRYDDMSWLGQSDKRVFRLLTAVGGNCLVSAHSRSLMPAKGLHGRTLIALPRSTDFGLSLEIAAGIEKGAGQEYWLLGGQTLATVALDAGHVSEIFMCRSTTIRLSELSRCGRSLARMVSAIPDLITPQLYVDGWEPGITTVLEGTEVTRYRRK